MDSIDIIMLALMLASLFYYDISSKVVVEEDKTAEVAPPQAAVKKGTPKVAPKPAKKGPVPEPAHAQQSAPKPAATATGPAPSTLPGCEIDGPAYKELSKKYPNLAAVDVQRYLVARKGVVSAASEMIDKYDVWRAKNFPLKKEQMRSAFDTNCIFSHGEARDGSPILYFRY